MTRFFGGDRMIIGLHDSDRTGFPNLALMKMAAFYKQQGEIVRWFTPMDNHDAVFSSKVFTFTEPDPYLPEDAVRGGTGYGNMDELPKCIDDMFPDYSMYPKCDHAIGFLTRGCTNNCSWCIVPKKEGGIRPYRAWNEVKRADKRNIVFMDNNVLACDWGIEQIEEMIGEDVRIDFNQGLDARLITDDVAAILAQLKWIRFIRMSCDTDAMLPVVLKAVNRLGKYGVLPYRIFVYLLVQDVKSTEQRAIRLRDAGVEVFAQPYRDFSNSIEPTQEQKDLARWVNRKEIFKLVPRFKDYIPRRRT